MNITKMQMESIAMLLNSDDLTLIASKAGYSRRTVEAVIQLRRQNENLKKQILKQAITKYEEVGKVLNQLLIQQDEMLNIEAYESIKNSSLWASGREYDRYTDVYLQLCLYSFSGIDDLWAKIKTEFPDVIMLKYYCIDLIIRIIGVNARTAISYFNQKV